MRAPERLLLHALEVDNDLMVSPSHFKDQQTPSNAVNDLFH